MLNLTFWGACDTVTGSSYLLTTDRLRILIDCGLFQGGGEQRDRNQRPFPFAPNSIDYVVLTHAHIDHSGLIPKLVKDGFRGHVMATSATADLCQIMLLDSAHLQEMEAEWSNRKRRRAGEGEMAPLYTVDDARRSLEQFQGIRYGQRFQLSEAVSLRFHDAGHILGSAIAELTVREAGKETVIVFSGDLGARNHPIVRDPSLIAAADYVVMESTYGNRIHENKAERSEVLKTILMKAVKDQERVVIPAFAVGRTQDILHEIAQLHEAGEIPLIPVYVDSPLAISATEIFARHPEVFDEETRAMLQSGKSPFDYPGLRFTREVEESRALNELQGAAVIISASGMCEAGRIKHHLKHNLWRPGAQVLFVGYQAEGTLGRRIKDGAPEVTIFGEEIAVNAQISAIEGFSAHGDQEDLSHWISGFTKKPRKVFVTHGEPSSRHAWAERLTSEFGLVPIVPELGQEFDLENEASPITTVQAAPSPEEADLAIVDALWRQARPALLRSLTAKGRKLPRQGERLLHKLAEVLQEIIVKLGR